MAMELGKSSSAGNQDPPLTLTQGTGGTTKEASPEHPTITLLKWAKAKMGELTDAELAYINEPSSEAPATTLWKEWTMIRKEDQPDGVCPAKPKRKIAPFGVLEADTPVPPILCKRLAIWLPQELDKEDLAARKELIQNNLAIIWMGNKRAVSVLVQRNFHRQERRNLLLLKWAREKKAAEERAAREKEEKLEIMAREEAERIEREEEATRQ